jgi:hypothetical protein
MDALDLKEKTTSGLKEIVRNILGPTARMITNSKSEYVHFNPCHVVIFNADIVANNERVWHGDIDLTLDEEKLVELAQQLGTSLSVYHESKLACTSSSDPSYIVDTEIKPFKEEGLRFCERNDEGNFVLRQETTTSEDEHALIGKGKERAKQFNEDDLRENVKLPSIDKLKVKNKDNPLFQLGYMIEKIVPGKKEDTRTNLTCLYICDEYYGSLRKICIAWAIAEYYSDLEEDDAEYKASKDVGWLFFDMGPASFGKYSSPDWARPDHAYFRQGEFYK